MTWEWQSTLLNDEHVRELNRMSSRIGLFQRWTVGDATFSVMVSFMWTFLGTKLITPYSTERGNKSHHSYHLSSPTFIISTTHHLSLRLSSSLLHSISGTHSIFRLSSTSNTLICENVSSPALRMNSMQWEKAMIDRRSRLQNDTMFSSQG